MPHLGCSTVYAAGRLDALTKLGMRLPAPVLGAAAAAAQPVKNAVSGIKHFFNPDRVAMMRAAPLQFTKEVAAPAASAAAKRFAARNAQTFSDISNYLT